jgi:hypothetical protein
LQSVNHYNQSIIAISQSIQSVNHYNQSIISKNLTTGFIINTWWSLPEERICKRLRSPPAYVVRRAGTSNRVVVLSHQARNRFLGSLKGLQIRALKTEPVTKKLIRHRW